MEEMSFTVTNKEGMEVKCDVLSIINDDENNTYLLYTDYTLNDNNEYNVYASQMHNDENGFKLDEIENLDLIPGLQEVYMDVKNQLSLQEKNI